MQKSFAAVATLLGDDGRPFVESSGLDHKLAKVWRDQLTHIDEELLVWGRKFQQQYAASAPPFFHADDAEDPEEVDVYEDAEEDSEVLTN